MKERETIVENGDVRLAGTTCLPDGSGPFAFVVFVHGSGPLDRDENMPGQRLDVLKTLAHRFAALGSPAFDTTSAAAARAPVGLFARLSSPT
jgi:hypothetical protein